MSNKPLLKAISVSVAIIGTGITSLFSARYAIGLLISRQRCDALVPWGSYWLIQTIPIFFAGASVLLALDRKRNGLAVNASRLSVLLVSLLCIHELATLHLTFSDGVFLTSCAWADWKDLEETYGFVVVPAFVIFALCASLIVGLYSLFHRKN